MIAEQLELPETEEVSDSELQEEYEQQVMDENGQIRMVSFVKQTNRKTTRKSTNLLGSKASLIGKSVNGK